MTDGIAAAARDRAQRIKRTTRRSVTTILSPRGLRGAAVEVAWLTTHVAMYPLGLAEEKARHGVERHNLEGLPPVQRGLFIGDVEAAGTPIILLHGVVDNRSIFALLRRGLRRRGFGRVVALNYSPLSQDIRAVAERLAQLIEEVVRETGYERVHVVGHSMGGLVGRYYVQRMGGDERVHTLVTLGSPHAGTAPARLVPIPVSQQMAPNSDIVQELDAPAPGCRTRFLSVWSDLDQMIIPKRSARLVHPDLNARNVFVRGVGHMSLPVDGRVVHEICTTLAHLDHDGSILTEGVTSIAAQRPKPPEVPRPRGTRTRQSFSTGA
ncbi:MAG: alpha/beta fold hydrolase [Candidatus Nanopelagicales bacterium]